MDALHRYLQRRARSEGAASSPQRFVHGSVEDLAISRNPLAGSSRLDPDSVAALADENWRTRLGAVTELTQQMRDGDIIAARVARLALQRHLRNSQRPERDYRVREAITNALAEEEKRRAETAPREREEQRRAEVMREAAARELEAEAARMAVWEKQRAEAASQAEKEHNAELARQAEKERDAELARQAEE